MNVNNNNIQPSVDFHDENATENALRQYFNVKLQGSNFSESMIKIETVFFNFTTNKEGQEDEKQEDGELEMTRKIVLQRSSPSHALEVFGAFWSQMVLLNIDERYFPDKYSLENNILPTLFQDAARTRQFDEALQRAYTSCSKIYFYASLENEGRTDVRIENSVHIQRAYNAGKIAGKVTAIVISILSIFAILKK